MELCLLLSGISFLVWCSWFMPDLGIPLLVKVSTTIKFNTKDFSLGFADITDTDFTYAQKKPVFRGHYSEIFQLERELRKS